jgi:tRNA G18 (ribose-2'-O)-methylase SpoU
MNHQALIDRFRGARSDHTLVVLEGFHPLKHAMRFGAELLEVAGVEDGTLGRLVAEYAPDTADKINELLRAVPATVFEQLAPVKPPTGVIAIAKRPEISSEQILDDPSDSPVVLLENPRNQLNIGAAIRVSAAAGAAGVLTTGPQDPWNPAAVIAATGLQYALPVTRIDTLPDCDRSLVVIDPNGEPLRSGSLPPHAVLAFGAEREGLSQELMARADHCVSIPMSPGVSSLNLATAVSAVLYAWKLGL